MKKELAIILLLLFNACNVVDPLNTRTTIATNINSADNKMIKNDKQDLPAWQEIVLSKANLKDWKVKVDKLGSDNLTDIGFVDPDNGWVISQNDSVLNTGSGILYKTNDAGKTWNKIGLSIPNGSYISKAFFLTKSKGWIVIQAGSITNQATPTTLSILTTDDGGLTWTPQIRFNDSYASKLIFNNNGEGWLTGFTRKPTDSDIGVGLILHTRNFGVTWNDVSPKNSNIIKSAEDGLTITANRWNDINIVKEFTVIALSDGGEILRTVDGGSTWEVVSKIPFDGIGITGLSSGTFSLLKMIDASRFLVLSGRNSQEGTLANFIIVDKNEIDQRYRLPDVYISDVVYLNNKLIACGTKLQVNRQKNQVDRSGIILYTEDMKTWKILHETVNSCTHGCTFNKISVFNNIFVGAGNDGNLIKLQVRN